MRIWYFIVGNILMTSQATESGQKALLSCKKCGTDHEKPIGNKCERLKLDKMEREEKRDLSKEGNVKKTPKWKSTAASNNHIFHRKIICHGRAHQVSPKFRMVVRLQLGNHVHVRRNGDSPRTRVRNLLLQHRTQLCSQMRAFHIRVYSRTLL